MPDATGADVNPVLRVIAVASIFLGAYVLVWLPGMLLLGDLLWLGSVVALAIAAAVALYAWRLGPAGPQSVPAAVALGALMIGGAGFAAGAGLGLWYGLKSGA